MPPLDSESLTPVARHIAVQTDTMTWLVSGIGDASPYPQEPQEPEHLPKAALTLVPRGVRV